MIVNKIQFKAIRSLLLIAIVILATAASSANAQSQTKTQSQRYERIMREEREIAAAFSKTSSTAIPVDEGNRIVAVRRITLIFDRQGETEKQNLVEVELYSEYRLPVSNANLDYVFFGEKVFILFVAGDRQRIFVWMKPAEFEEIKDNALVTVMPLPISLESLRNMIVETYKNGEPKEVSGAKFGRLTKAMIDKFPPLEENSESSLKRIQK